MDLVNIEWDEGKIVDVRDEWKMLLKFDYSKNSKIRREFFKLWKIGKTVLKNIGIDCRPSDEGGELVYKELRFWYHVDELDDEELIREEAINKWKTVVTQLLE
jgi:hypothetical protein